MPELAKPMMPHLPEKVKVAGVVYDIIWDNNLSHSSSYGRCNSEALLISLDPAAKLARRGETLLHEVLEAIKSEYKLNLKHEQIDLLGTAIYQVFQDNPTVVAWITSPSSS